MDRKEGKYLYEEIQDIILELVKKGELKAGEKVPSLRSMSKKLNTSVTTVMKAYMELERKGFLESRPKSGYFLKDAEVKTLPLPDATTPIPEPNPVSKFDLVLQLYYSMGSRDSVCLNVAEPHFELVPSDELARIMKKAISSTPNHNAYEFMGGQPELKRQIAYHMLSYNTRVQPDRMMITNGSSEALFIALTILARPGDSVIVESPCFFGYLNTLHALGIYALEIPTHPDKGMDLDALEQSLNRYDVKACITQTNFNNPLGYSIPPENRDRIVEMCSKSGVPIIEEDIYGDLPHDGKRPDTLLSRDYDNVIYISSFSKTLAPGYRVGWLYSERYYTPIFRYKTSTTVDTVRPTQLAIAEFMASGKYARHLEKFRNVCASNVSLFSMAISKYFPEGTRITRPKGGFILWVELPKGVDTLNIYRRAAHERIHIAPGTIFSSQDRYSNCMRLNCAVPWNERTESALKRLGELGKAEIAGK
ncbi:PLP-dependent aminotransferase family protein [Limisalsivibrio acetivorans]|uniref:aminotransferase-like domain-containing protein n=1 Tax=Limisalsivibrio acetivorans TaxID=1304888 RepID=UPI0003B2F3E9|nr:PLP-dependent aminotransferase family protein [Limisalsivibrio acetivorans]